jgi:hypothetical protein
VLVNFSWGTDYENIVYIISKQQSLCPVRPYIVLRQAHTRHLNKAMHTVGGLFQLIAYIVRLTFSVEPRGFV